MSDADCSDFECGLDEPCEGLCQDLSVSLVEPSGVNALSTSEDGLPITIHVIDAWHHRPNQRVATYGGGDYFPVDLSTSSALTVILEGLVQTKPEVTLCE